MFLLLIPLFFLGQHLELLEPLLFENNELGTQWHVKCCVCVWIELENVLILGLVGVLREAVISNVLVLGRLERPLDPHFDIGFD